MPKKTLNDVVMETVGTVIEMKNHIEALTAENESLNKRIAELQMREHAMQSATVQAPVEE